jgi:hypothetical protein
MSIENPYKDVPEEDCQRLNAQVPRAVMAHLTAVYPTHGFKQAVVNLFLETFIQDLKDNDIQFYTGQETIDAVERVLARRLRSGATAPTSQS